MASGLSGPWLTANSALVPDGSSHNTDSKVSAPTSGCNAYTPIDAGREPVGLGEDLAGSGNCEWDACWLGELWVGQAAQALAWILGSHLRAGAAPQAHLSRCMEKAHRG